MKTESPAATGWQAVGAFLPAPMNTEPPFQKIAILGPGLLGGSLAMALRRIEPAPHVRIWGRRSDAVDAARARTICDGAFTSLEETVAEADLVVLCVPVEAMPALATSMRAHLSPSAVVTDVGSVKQQVVQPVRAALAGAAQFVGSHPMAGSEQAGIEAAREDLFDGAACLVTPVPENRREDVERVAAFWTSVGCRVRELSPQRHDEAVALISHLPHLTAAVLTDLVQSNDPAAFDFCGNGFRDSTRIASGSAAMWTGIFRSNREAVRESIDAMIEKLREFGTLLDAGRDSEVEAFLARAKAARDRLKAH